MTVLSNFVQQLNKKYGTTNPIQFAKNLFKENVDTGSAIISVLSSTGIAGFKFHVPQSEQVKMESDITDHYSDANTPFQDHIARRPIQVTLTGLQGEYFYSVNEIEDTLALITPAITLCKQYIPKLSAATMQAKTGWQKYQKSLETATKNTTANIGLWDKTKMAWQNLNGVDLFRLFQEVYKLTSAQTRAFLYLQALWLSNQPFSVETTWRRYDNMLIQSVQPIRDNNADITEFTVVFKQVNFTQSQYTDLKNAAKLTRQQLMQRVNKGVSKGKEVSVT